MCDMGNPIKDPRVSVTVLMPSNSEPCEWYPSRCRGSPLSAFPWVLPCPLNIPETSIVFKVLILVNIQWERAKIKDHFSGWIDSSFNLNMLITCFLCCWLSWFFSLSHFRWPAASVTKSPNFWAGTRDRPPLLQNVRTFGLGPPHPPKWA